MKERSFRTCKTKIIATIGPSSRSKPVLQKMIATGMNVARLNLSHGNPTEHGEVIDRIRSLSKKMNRPVAILLDLQGPKIRIGKLQNGKPFLLKRKRTIRITTKEVSGTPELISTIYANLARDVKKDETIFLDDGRIKIKVTSKAQDTVTCRVINGGVLRENTGINLPGSKVSAPSLTEKDKQDIRFGIESGIDYFALSFVRSADDIKNFKLALKKQRSDIPVLAKIEKREAVNDLDGILDVAAGIMVARGDLGIEMRLEQVPTIQKLIIDKAIRSNKPVITATQMLETMHDNPIPTRAEVSDVANAILDGTDAIMLSGETASGKYPVEAVKMMTRIAAETESSPFMRYNIQHNRSRDEIIAMQRPNRP